jgi:hypothetical protein
MMKHTGAAVLALVTMIHQSPMSSSADLPKGDGWFGLRQRPYLDAQVVIAGGVVGRRSMRRAFLEVGMTFHPIWDKRQAAKYIPMLPTTWVLALRSISAFL